MRFPDHNKPFWVVVSDERGMASFPYIHTDLVAAQREAERLTRLNGGRFVVFQAISVSQRIDVHTRTLGEESEEGMPF